MDVYPSPSNESLNNDVFLTGLAEDVEILFFSKLEEVLKTTATNTTIDASDIAAFNILTPSIFFWISCTKYTENYDPNLDVIYVNMVDKVIDQLRIFLYQLENNGKPNVSPMPFNWDPSSAQLPPSTKITPYYFFYSIDRQIDLARVVGTLYVQWKRDMKSFSTLTARQISKAMLVAALQLWHAAYYPSSTQDIIDYDSAMIFYNSLVQWKIELLNGRLASPNLQLNDYPAPYTITSSRTPRALISLMDYILLEWQKEEPKQTQKNEVEVRETVISLLLSTMRTLCGTTSDAREKSSQNNERYNNNSDRTNIRSSDFHLPNNQANMLISSNPNISSSDSAADAKTLENLEKTFQVALETMEKYCHIASPPRICQRSVGWIEFNQICHFGHAWIRGSSFLFKYRKFRLEVFKWITGYISKWAEKVKISKRWNVAQHLSKLILKTISQEEDVSKFLLPQRRFIEKLGYDIFVAEEILPALVLTLPTLSKGLDPGITFIVWAFDFFRTPSASSHVSSNVIKYLERQIISLTKHVSDTDAVHQSRGKEYLTWLRYRNMANSGKFTIVRDMMKSACASFPGLATHIISKTVEKLKPQVALSILRPFVAHFKTLEYAAEDDLRNSQKNNVNAMDVDTVQAAK